jgi:hypothetical protein
VVCVVHGGWMYGEPVQHPQCSPCAQNMQSVFYPSPAQLQGLFVRWEVRHAWKERGFMTVCAKLMSPFQPRHYNVQTVLISLTLLDPAIVKYLKRGKKHGTISTSCEPRCLVCHFSQRLAKLPTTPYPPSQWVKRAKRPNHESQLIEHLWGENYGGRWKGPWISLYVIISQRTPPLVCSLICFICEATLPLSRKSSNVRVVNSFAWT